MDQKTQQTPRNNNIIGIDIGGTGVKGGIVDPKSGKLQGAMARVPTPQPATPQAVATAVNQLVQELEQREDAPGLSSAVGITFPGIVSKDHARSAAHMDSTWIGCNITALFAEALNRPVKVLNDADAAGLAEVHYGVGRNVDGTVLMLTLGTGIGSAFIFNGTLVPNAELGHLEIDGANAESKASAVARERQELPWEDYSEILQRYLSHVEFLFSPELIIIGGGISEKTDEYLPHIKLRTPIMPATLKNKAGVIGAALQASMQPGPRAAHTLPPQR
ncbi:ROK family protein [Paenarthrobacter sp. TYUT067]|uniref:polyphosphate--glucose phosphotransferase n=1 Tax=Paenarthrobacter sp. TYUT067 TaxID=2926245 RepID=UPI0020304284|nr:ROK family protein [Paenarthrobacter sp. TYUT067]MCM0618554.1 ROK family protein [Paenarthrobacter sp. TYUT067]